MTEVDKEIKAISTIASAFTDLSEEECARVLRWAAGKYGAGLSKSDDALFGGNGSGDREAGELPDYTGFAELYDACSPKTGVDKALVAGYWLQVVQNNPSFASGPLHDELKNLGHPISNITDALSNNMKTKPALVMQIKKSGSSKQARKLYKLTTAGIKLVENWIRGVDAESK